MKHPTRFIRLAEARARHGSRVDRLGGFLSVGDPMADEAVDALAGLPHPERDALVTLGLDRGADALAKNPAAPKALVDLMRSFDHVPFWVDFGRTDRGGEVFLRAGIFGGMVLGCYSLIAGYCSPAGNKPLAFSGRLAQNAPRRLAETSQFVQQVSTPGGMLRHAAGFKSAARVRLVHASVRRMLQRSPRWDSAAWGLPINQFDMVGTGLLFSHIANDGLTRLGFRLTLKEREDVLHLWRYTAWVMGVAEELVPATEAEAVSLWDIISTTQAMPDEDSRRLTQALLDAGEQGAKSPEDLARARRMRPLAQVLSRHFLGDDIAAWIGLPVVPPAWKLLVPSIRAVVGQAETISRVVPGANHLRTLAGSRYWDEITARGLAGLMADFPMPDSLANLR